jgi:hypothetical protein
MSRGSLNLDDCEGRNLNVVINLGDYRYAERESGRGDPRVVDRQAFITTRGKEVEAVSVGEFACRSH